MIPPKLVLRIIAPCPVLSCGGCSGCSGHADHSPKDRPLPPSKSLVEQDKRLNPPSQPYIPVQPCNHVPLQKHGRTW